MTEPRPTASQTVGPFFSFGLCGGHLPGPDLVAAGEPGALRVEGTVIDGAGDPVPDALVEVWQADAGGRYPADPAAAFRGAGRCGTDAEGHFHFTTRKPGAVPHPAGAVQAPHLAVTVFARGLLKPLRTRMYFPDEAGANAVDPVLGALPGERRHTLVARAADGVLVFDIRLQGEDETVFLEFTTG